MNFVRSDQLFEIGPSTISIYSAISNEVVMVVQFLATDYEKALPNFVKILNVPFVALSEVANRNYKLNDTSCIIFLRSYTKFADDAWFKYCGLPTERSI